MSEKIEKKIKELQDKIENTDSYMTKSYLLLKKIELLRILEVYKEQKKLTNKEIIEQLEEDLKNERTA